VVAHQVAKQQAFAVPAAEAQPLRFGLREAGGGEGLAPVRPGAGPVGRLHDVPLPARVGVAGVEALAALGGLAGLDRDADAARSASAGATGHAHRPSQQRSGAVQRPNRTWSGPARGGAKTRRHSFNADSWHKRGWLHHESGGLRRMSMNVALDKRASDMRLCRSPTFAGVR